MSRGRFLRPEPSFGNEWTSTRRIIAAADGSKLGRTAHAHVGPATLVHTLVTDTTAPPDELAALEATGTLVTTA